MVLVIDARSGAVRRRILADTNRTGADASLETLEDMGAFLPVGRRQRDADNPDADNLTLTTLTLRT